jgi:hypothetical protein
MAERFKKGKVRLRRRIILMSVDEYARFQSYLSIRNPQFFQLPITETK